MNLAFVSLGDIYRAGIPVMMYMTIDILGRASNYLYGRSGVKKFE